MYKNDKRMCNEIITSDLTDAGFDVRWNLSGGLIVSLDRPLLASEVKNALYDASYDDSQFVTTQHGTFVVIDAVV